MLPLYLSIEGLYSYQEKQEIDFTQLTEAGLFGIFGNVGSGKSSILEAISYALYGETERLNKQEKRSYNMLNLKSDQAIIDFQFLNFENRKFRFVVQWKRRKRFEDTTSIERTAYEWMSNDWKPMESADGSLVTNLSYPNFRRTIIIPQGQFQEFLELKGKDRSDMMKEIFFLNQYDLGPKVAYLQAENNKKVENLKGALTGFEEVTIEIKDQKTIELQEAKENYLIVKQEFEILSEEYKKLVTANENRLDLATKEAELNTLNVKRPQIELQEKEITEFELITSNFKEPINQLHQISATKEQLLLKIEKLQENKDYLNSKINNTQNQILEIQADFDDLENLKKQLNEYQLLLLNLDLKERKKEILARIEKGSPVVLETKAKELALTEELNLEESKLEEVKSKRINTSELLAVESWFKESDQLVEKENELNFRLNSINIEIKELVERFDANSVEESSWQQTMKQLADSMLLEQQKIQDREAALRLKQELSHYILNLHDGESCPLCGSIEHPNKMHTDDLSAEINEINNLKSNWKKTESELHNLQNLLSTTALILTEKRNTKLALAEDVLQINSKKQEHNHKFQWNEFDKTNRERFEEQKKNIKQLEDIINNKELIIKNLRISLQTTKDNVIKYEKSINDFKNQAQILDANIDQNKSQISNLSSLLDSNSTKLELTLAFNQTEEKITTVSKLHKEWTDQLNSSKNELATVLGQFSETQEQYKSYNQQLQSIQNSIYKLLNAFKYADLAEVILILDKKLNITAIKENIQAFRIRFSALSERINELQLLTSIDNFSIEKLKNCKELLALKTEELEKQIILTGSLEKELQTLIIELDKKVNLVSEFEKLNARKENLRILDNMFKGNGFVNYVSSIHLERLCEIANQRFHRLTKNQLSLCVNESNEFEVKDYLNNGYQRSVKTLSGGQSFQASLCLALALAENIQALNKADRNFFFIDEGFGTQDNESINTVFDTLQYLNQENRVVGIISHVEELKERMPRSISITKDMEKGSQIKYN